MAYRTRKNKGKMHKTRKYKHRHNRKMSRRHRKGGQNIGANTCDPNYSIYNTNFLKLFPYKA